MKLRRSLPSFTTSLSCHSCFFLLITQRYKQDKICSPQLEMVEFAKMEQELMISDPSADKSVENKWLSLEKWRKNLYTEASVLAVDEISLVLFPVSFGIFNLIYWTSIAKDTVL